MQTFSPPSAQTAFMAKISASEPPEVTITFEGCT